MNKNESIIFILATTILLLLVAPTLSYAATSGIRSCDDNKPCVVTYKNGSQAVELSNAKFKCMDKILQGIIENTATNGVTISSNFTVAIADIGIAICLQSG